jgi:hypothetical protein
VPKKRGWAACLKTLNTELPRNLRACSAHVHNVVLINALRREYTRGCALVHVGGLIFACIEICMHLHELSTNTQFACSTRSGVRACRKRTLGRSLSKLSVERKAKGQLSSNGASSDRRVFQIALPQT